MAESKEFCLERELFFFVMREGQNNMLPLIDRMLDKGVIGIDDKDDDGTTALEYASRTNNAYLFNHLKKKGATLLDDQEVEFFYDAIQSMNLDLIKEYHARGFKPIFKNGQTVEDAIIAHCGKLREQNHGDDESWGDFFPRSNSSSGITATIDQLDELARMYPKIKSSKDFRHYYRSLQVIATSED